MPGAFAMTDERSYTPDEVAEIIHTHVKTVLRMIGRGELEAFTVGKHYRIKKSVLDRFMDGRKPKNDESR